VVILYGYGWRQCEIGASFPLHGSKIMAETATDGDVQLTVLSQPIHLAFKVAMLSPDKLQAEESDVPAVLHVGLGITTGQ
jgi:hypothetical protein